MKDEDDIQAALEDCAAELQELKAGGQLVTAAPGTFVRLADKIEAVIEERRKAERRHDKRPTPDRRRTLVGEPPAD